MTGAPDFLTATPCRWTAAVTPFAEIIQSFNVTGGLFLDAEFTAPWCVSAQIGADDCSAYTPVPAKVVAFHYVSEGRVHVSVKSSAPLVVEAGEVVLVPRNDPHTLGSDLSLAPVDTENLIRPGDDGGLARIEHGGGGEPTKLVCGFLGTDSRHAPVLALLPPLLKIRMDDPVATSWIESSFRLAARATAAPAQSSPGLLTPLAELLFAAAVRRHFDSIPDDAAHWSAGISDPKIADALGRLHADLARHWTTDHLAAEVAMSRSAFAARFRRVMGEAPMRYLGRQRLGAAARRLQDSPDPIARIAADAGYDSEASFSRAFRREYALPPAAWRRARATHTETAR
jgi:AraC-like DNA-binding protein